MDLVRPYLDSRRPSLCCFMARGLTLTRSGSTRPLIQNAQGLSRRDFGTHEFIEPLVSHCCATPFRLLVQTKGSKGKDARVTRRRCAPNHCQSNKKFSGRRVRQKLGRLSPPSNTLPHRRSAPGTLRPCASRSLHTGPEYRRVTHSSELVRLHTGIKAIGYVLVGLRLRLIRPTPIVTLSER